MPDICYIKGQEIIVADMLSCLPPTNDTEKPYVIMPSHEELADCFDQDTEENWPFPISITLIKSI
jgi:hypothetical protein